MDNLRYLDTIYNIFKCGDEVRIRNERRNTLIPIGFIKYDNVNEKLFLCINGCEPLEYDNIIEIFSVCNTKNLLIYSNNGLYSEKIHCDTINKINRFGIGIFD